MSINSLLSFIRSYYKTLNERQRSIIILVVPICALLVCFIFFKAIFLFFHKPNNVQAPLFIRQGNQILVPNHSPLRSQLVIEAVKALSVPHEVSIPGVVESQPYTMVDILPPGVGRLIRLKVDLGDYVERDQVIAVIRSPDLALAYSDYKKAQSARKYALNALYRAKKVNQAGANSLKDVELADTNYKQAIAELKRTQAVLKALGQHHKSLLTIKSPVRGRVVSLNYGLGSYITDSTSPILTIANNYSVWVTANVPENLVALVKPGLAADISLSAYPSLHWHGKVNFVNAIVESDSRRNKTRIVIDNPELKLQPNMYATVHMAFPQQKQIMVPVTAVVMNDDTTSVYVEVQPWVFERHRVWLGAEDLDKVRVVAGLKPGELVVTLGGILVND